jgi:hypothetical protein
MTPRRLRDLPRDAKVFLTAFLVVLLLGYVSGLSYVYLTTRMLPGGIAAHYAGSADEATMDFPKSPLALMQTTHNHVLSLSLVFALVDALLFATALSPRLRTALVVESFGAIVTSFGSLWLIRYVSPLFAWLLLASGVAMAATFFVSIAVVIGEIWRTGGRLPQVSANTVENC